MLPVTCELTAVSYDTLCRQKLFAADFDAVTSIDIALNGENYSGVPINAEKKLRVKEKNRRERTENQSDAA